jgi:signal transduction histidine kinase
MLAFARRQELKPETVLVHRLVAGMTDMLSRALGPTIEVVTAFPAELDPVMVDANQLELALLNLAVNAKDAMPAGGRITISADEVSADENTVLKPGRYVRLTVADTGEGMNAATLSHATEPFFTTKGKGFGLGLFLSKASVTRAGGSVKLYSHEEGGTLTELRLPRVARGDIDE